LNMPSTLRSRFAANASMRRSHKSSCASGVTQNRPMRVT
jgi:hypothetical protein